MQSKDSSFDEGTAQNLSTFDNYSLTDVIANKDGLPAKLSCENGRC